MNKDKSVALKELATSISDSFGEGSLMSLGDTPKILKNQENRVSTGYYDVDWALSGGLVKGGQTEIYGNEGDGKTTLALTIMGECQKNGMSAYFLDAEHKLNIGYAQTLGVDIKNLLITQPNHGEHGLDVAQAVLSSGLVDVMVVDSVTALVPLAEINGDFTDANMGAHARLMSKMCRVLTPIISSHKIIVIYINQIRQKLGVFYGSPETTTGGKALKFYCGTRIKVSSQQIKSGNNLDITRRNVTMSVVKQQWGVPYTKIDTQLNLGYGFSKELDIISYGLRLGVLEMASSSVRMDGKSLGNGKVNAGIKLLADKELLKQFNKKMKELND